jgi:hypothetical protein
LPIVETDELWPATNYLGNWTVAVPITSRSASSLSIQYRNGIVVQELVPTELRRHRAGSWIALKC